MTATRGERGTADPVAWPPDRLAAERTHELARCLDILGVARAPLAGLRATASAPRPTAAAAVARLCAVHRRVRPDTVLTFGPDGITGHPDHRTVSAWAAAAVDRAGPPGARLLHAATDRAAGTRAGARSTSGLGVYQPGYPVLTPGRAAGGRPGAGRRDIAARKVRALAAQQTQTAGLIADPRARRVHGVGRRGVVRRGGPACRVTAPGRASAVRPSEVALDGVPGDGEDVRPARDRGRRTPAGPAGYRLSAGASGARSAAASRTAAGSSSPSRRSRSARLRRVGPQVRPVAGARRSSRRPRGSRAAPRGPGRRRRAPRAAPRSRRRPGRSRPSRGPGRWPARSAASASSACPARLSISPAT